jgi:hypothetical protein
MEQKTADILWDQLSAPARRALEGAGLKTLRDLSSWSEADVAALDGIGPNAIKILRAAMEKNGLSFSK